MLAPWVPAIGRRHRLAAGAGLFALFGLAAVAGGAGRAQGPNRFDPLAPIAPLAAMVVAGARGGRRENRLAREKSPYLLQHAHNPVDWYPWGEEAFAKAKAESKPIFLSIGYSTCHWCHVMERESFEDDAVAALLNEHYVPVKVDREERPDVDRVYMTAMQAMGMGGGWPLTVFLTPELEPFFGGTYFAPRAMHGRPGMVELLPRVHEAWVRDRERITDTGARVFQALATLDDPTEGEPASAPKAEALVQACYEKLEQAFDVECGGFGDAPKFPQAVNLTFLFRHYSLDPEERSRSRDLAVRQLDGMRAGGIHDHLGGGFHRYATDRAWRVPHFEKMLYDQAQLAWAYLDAYQLCGREADAVTARRIFAYVARDLAAPEGAFFSAEDADSEGEEGKFYVWTPDELEAVIGAEAASIASYHWGVTAGGNFEAGASILYEAHSIAETAAHAHRSEDEARATIERAREALLEARGRRPRPHCDDKVLAAWNGLMISAFARGARVLDDPTLAGHAERAGQFVWTRLWDPERRMMRRRYRDGDAAIDGQLDDYAYVTLGFLDLYRTRLDPVWLERAVHVTNAQIERFWDDKRGGFFESPAGDPHLRVRMKDDFDGAEIAGNSIAAENLWVLGELLDLEKWRAHAERMLDYYARKLLKIPLAMPHMLAVMQARDVIPRHVVIAGTRDAPDVRAMVREFDRRYLPLDVLLLAEPGDAGRRLAALVPFVSSLQPQAGRAVAYVCVNGTCRLPTTDPAVLADQLERRDDPLTGAPA